MALDQEYFDSIHIDLVKKKYYNANKVDAVLNDIRAQALAMASDNASMRSELNAKNNRTYEVGDAIISANALARRLVDEAGQKAAAIIEEAEKRAAALEKETAERCGRMTAASEKSRELALSRMEASFSRLREQYRASIETVNEEWRLLLCELYDDQLLSPEEDAAEPAVDDEPGQSCGLGGSVDISDIDAKVSAILEGINEINEDM